LYSDRIHHALAFAAKHYPERVSRYDGHSCLIRASSVAVILARYGADECTIVSSILKLLVDAAPYPRQATLAEEVHRKFGGPVAETVKAAAEPRFDVLGRERTWKACRLEHLSRLMAAPPRAIDVCVAEELHRLGTGITAIRRLGVEYIDPSGIPTRDDTVWWYRSLLDALYGHEHWRRLEMLSELHRMFSELAHRLDGT
jgi:(p)ppGpp synthase/HD superfamily hydrolase